MTLTFGLIVSSYQAKNKNPIQCGTQKYINLSHSFTEYMNLIVSHYIFFCLSKTGLNTYESRSMGPMHKKAHLHVSKQFVTELLHTALNKTIY